MTSLRLKIKDEEGDFTQIERAKALKDVKDNFKGIMDTGGKKD